VEGAHFRTSRDDEAKHAVDVLEHVTCGNAHHAESFVPKQRITSRVAARLVAKAVALAIDFYDKPSFQTGEIDGHFTDRELPPELQPGGPFAEMLPQKDFR